MASKCVEVPTANEYQLRDAESGGAPGQGPDIMPLSYVVYYHEALNSHFYKPSSRERERERVLRCKSKCKTEQ